MFRSAPGTADFVHGTSDQLESRVPLATLVQRRRADHGLHDDVPRAPQRPVQTSDDSQAHHVVLSERKLILRARWWKSISQLVKSYPV